MKKFLIVESKAAVLSLSNVDTDIIAPMKRLLKNMGEIGKYAFEPLRFVNGDGDSGVLNEKFSLNRMENKEAQILIVGDNFGCGSSREQAAQGIADMGIRCLIGSSFGSIFYDNCFQYGILPICLDEGTIKEFIRISSRGKFTVNLEKVVIITPEGRTVPFSVNSYQREMLMKGLDQVGVTLQKKKEIEAYETVDKLHRPWIYM